MQTFGKYVNRNGTRVTIDFDSEYEAEKLEKWANGDGIVMLEYNDNRKRTPAQLRKAWALIGEVARWNDGKINDKTKHTAEGLLKDQFYYETGFAEFSQSSCSVDMERQFIETILDFCFEHDVSFATKTWDMFADDYYAQYQALIHRKCVICGKHADIAHIFSVGIGRNRNKISHIGNYVMPLCRIDHERQHNMGIQSFMSWYHIKGIKVTQEIAQILKLGRWYDYDPNDQYVIRNYSELEYVL